MMSELDGQRYVDTGVGEDDASSIPHYGTKLSPNEHAEFYDDVRGHSEARSRPEASKVARSLGQSVIQCCAHPGDAEYDGLLDS